MTPHTVLLTLIIIVITIAAAVDSAPAAPSPNTIEPLATNSFVITSIYPVAGPNNGGTTIALMGSASIPQYELALTCKFEAHSDVGAVSASVSAQWISSSKVQCVTPKWNFPDVHPSLTLQVDEVQFSSIALPFFYYEQPTIESIQPSFGSVMGGTLVTVRGTGFHPLQSVVCRFGTTDVHAIWKGHDDLTCVTPEARAISSVLFLVSLNGVDYSPKTAVYRYVEATTVNSLRPTAGIISGGYAISVVGNGFEDSTYLSCVFRGFSDGSSIKVNATYHSLSELSCVAPSTQEPTQRLVYVSVNGVDLSIDGIKFDFLDFATILSIQPKGGPTTGGTKVSLYGLGFVRDDTLCCHFGNSKVRAEWISPQLLECKLPALWDGPSLVNVTLSHNGVKFSSNDVEFQYYKQPTISSLQPEVGTESGGTIVTIIGSDFLPSAEIVCRFGSVAVPGDYIDESKISCLSPPQSLELSCLVSVSLNGVDFQSSPVNYRYVEPDVLSIDPSYGYIFGGTKIRVAGSDFENTEQLACVFMSSSDGQMKTRATFLSSTLLECNSPVVSEPDQLSVKVSLNGVDVSYSSVNFVSKPPAIISNMIPSSGSTSGLSKVHLIGIGFLNGESIGCCFGNTTIPAEWISSTIVICKPIALNPKAGYATVSYTNDGVHFMAADNQFLFIQPPYVFDVSPTGGPQSGGTVVRVLADTVTNISASWKCEFGEIQVQASMISSSELTCESPPSQQDTVSIKLLLEEHAVEVDTGFVFRYYERIEIDSAFPDSAPTPGGTPVNIAVRGLRNSSYVCVFGNQEVSAHFFDSSLLVCDSPRWDYPETTTLSVRLDEIGAELAMKSNTVSFSLYHHPIIERATPTIFHAPYPQDVAILGHGFIDSDQIKCRIENWDVRGRWVSRNKVICLSSQIATSRPTEGHLLFSMNGVDFTDTEVAVRMLPEFSMSNIQPSQGSTLGGLKTAVTGRGFNDSIRYHCLFGHDIVEAEFINDTGLSCVTPFIPTHGPRPVSICVDTGDCTGTDTTFTFFEPLHIAQVKPTHGSVAGGTLVRFTTNQALTGSSLCWFGVKSVVIEPDGTFGGSCLSPPLHTEIDIPRAVDFHISTEGHIFSHGTFHFIYCPAEIADSASVLKNYSMLSPRDSYVEKLSIERVYPTIIARGSKTPPLIVECQNLLLDDGVFPIDSCHLGSSDAPALPVPQNASHFFICNFTELPTSGSYPLRFFSRQFGNIMAPNAVIRLIDNPTLSHLEPSIVVARDTIDIIVKGTNFLDHNLTCFMNEEAHQGIFVTSSLIICRVPGAGKMTSRCQVSVSNDGRYIVDLPSLSLEVLAAPSIATLEPPVGLPGSNVTLLGKSFHPRVNCHSNDIGILPTHFINSSVVQCSLPFDRHPDRITISLVLDDGVAVSNDAHDFTFVNLRVRSIHPTLGSVSGGTLVVFDMDDEKSVGVVTLCKFGVTTVSASILNDQLICTSPAVMEAGLVHVGVGLSDRDFLMSDQFFEYHAIPVFSSVIPNTGMEIGGTAVTLSGNNFVDHEEILCYFNDVEVTGRWVSEQKMICTTPKLHPGLYSIHVALNGVDKINTSLVFQVRPKMTTLFASPSFGKTSGGTMIQIFGTNFNREDNLNCRFGGKVSVHATFIGSNVLECITPSWGMAENIELGIGTENSLLSFVERGFEYFIPFRVSSISPENGPITGGTLVSIAGSGFGQAHDSVHCIIGRSSVVARIISDGELRCVTPPSSITGESDVSVAYGSDIFTMESQSFSYDEEILLVDRQSKVASTESEHVILVQVLFVGQKQSLLCKLEPGRRLLKASLVSDTEISCRLPQGLPPREYNMSISNNGQDFSDSSITVRVINPFKIHIIDPSVGLPGTTTLSLKGHGFQDVDGLSCLMGEQYIVPSYYVNPKLIKCTLPVVFSTGVVPISLGFGDGILLSNAINFTIVDLGINSIHPTSGSVAGGTPVVIRLDRNESIDFITHCKFGVSIVAAAIFDDTLLCVAPSAKVTGIAFIGLSVNGRDFSTSHFIFEYFNVTLSAVSPLNGPETGGTAVSVIGSNFTQSNSFLCYFEDIQVRGQWVSDHEIVCIAPKLKPGNYAITVSANSVVALESPFVFRADKAVDIMMVKPPIGVYSGTNVTVVGKAFIPSQHLSCSFGDFGAVSASYIGPSELTCESPVFDMNTSELISADVRVSLNGFDFSISSAPFLIGPRAEIESIHPNKGPVSGGTPVVVKGANFVSFDLSTPVCIFGTSLIPATIFSKTELTCLSPPGISDGEVPFSVSMNGVNHAQKGFYSFLYLPTIKTISVDPQAGPFTGGTLVTVTGMDFSQAQSIKCRFGESSTEVISLTHERIQCKSPSHPPGAVLFSVESLDSRVESVVFEYFLPYQVISAFPTTGPYHGGTLVKVFGRHFRPDGSYSCYFGNEVGVPGRVVSSDVIECNSPRMTHQDIAHAVELSVGDQHSNYTDGHMNFTYGPLFAVDYVQPRFVLFKGGDIISVVGNYFNSTEAWCRVTFESSLIVTKLASFVNNDRINCQVPPHVSTRVQHEAFIEVSSNAFDWSSTRLSFAYVPRPAIDTVGPELGPLSGGTLISISGSNFLEGSDLWCNFGVAGSVPIAWESSSQVYCVSPPVSIALQVAVSLHWKDSSSIFDTKHHFRYHRELSLEEIHPSRGFVTGGTVVTIFGTGFLNVSTLSCHFGSETVYAEFLSSTSIECVTPAVNYSLTVDLGVSLNGRNKAPHSELFFTYDPEPDFTLIVPNNVPVVAELGRESSIRNRLFVSVMGSFFMNGTQLKCKFDDTWITDAIFISESEVQCALPRITEPGIYRVAISYATEFSQKEAEIAFVKPALIKSIYPSKIQEGSPVPLTITGDNFISSSELQCRFGDPSYLWTHALWINESTLECMSPALNLTSDGRELVGISNNGGHSLSALVPLEVTARAHFLSMYPSLGYVTGGTHISIVIGNLKHTSSTKMVCQFDSTVVPARSVGSLINCVSPPHPRGKILVLLMSLGETKPLASGIFGYLDEPLIYSLQPSIGGLDGGTVVALRGSGFEHVTHCRFDNHIVPANIGSSKDSLICMSPSSDTARSALVQVTHNGQDFAPSSVRFSYRSKPTLSGIMPSYGGTLGGKRLYISGSNFSFSPTLKCSFGESIVEANFVSEAIISCKAPPMKLGKVPLSVSLNGVDFSSSPGLFYEAINLPQVTSFHPRVGRVLSNNTAVIVDTTSLPLSDRLACHFGGDIVPASYVTRNSVTCVAPVTDLARAVQVSVSVDGERLFENIEPSLQFNYVNHPVIESIAPNFGWTVGGTHVTLAMKNLEPFHSHELMCSFGGSNNFTMAIRAHADSISCVSSQFDINSMTHRAPIRVEISDGLNSFYIYGPIFSYLSPVIVTGIEPPVGSINGGSLVRLRGFNFPNMDGLLCYFGNITSAVQWLSENEVECISPAYTGGDKMVKMHIGIRSSVTLALESHASFHYLSNPIILGIYPRFGASTGGTRVVISLIYPWPNAEDYLTCRFGDSAFVAARVISQNEIACITPAKEGHLGHLKEEARVFLYAKHGQVLLASSEEAFTYMDPIEIISAQPDSGPLKGGTTVTLMARGMFEVDIRTLTCHFGNDAIVPVTSPVQKDDHWVCECITPQMSISSKNTAVLIELGFNGLRDVKSIGQVFTFYDTPTVNLVSPPVGFLEGGDLVKVRGENFHDSKQLRCLFGDKDSRSVLFVSSTELLCTTPTYDHKQKHRNQTVQVRVANNGVDFTEENKYSEYKYVHRPDASAVWPSVVDRDATSIINISGKDLLHVQGCKYGDAKQMYPTLSVTTNMITCHVPPLSSLPSHLEKSLTAYNMPIFLELENGVFPTGLEVRYEMLLPEVDEMEEPGITAVIPCYGSSFGGSWIRVYGKGFLNRNELNCNFGGVLGQHVHYISSSEVHCMTPKHSPGTVSFSVSNGGPAAVNTNLSFSFLFDISIGSVSPTSGSVRGGTPVNLYGSFQMSNDSNIMCKFGVNGIVAGSVVSEDHVVCISPKALIADTVELSVSIDGAYNFENSTVWFTYEPESEILDLLPSYGYTGSLAHIFVMGTHFRNATGLKCVFGEIKVGATFLTNKKVSCLHPPFAGAQRTPVSVFVEGDVIPSSWKYFEYINPPMITSYAPIFGDAVLAKGEVTVRGIGFRKVIQLQGRFGDLAVRAVVINSDTLICPIPSHPPGEVIFRLIDLCTHLSVEFRVGASFFHFLPESSVHSIIPTWNASQKGSLSFVRGANFNALATNAIATLTNSLFVDSSRKLGNYDRRPFVLEQRDILPAPNGTRMLKSAHNLTLCEPGTFQPQNGQSYCLLCPVGYICPYFGMHAPDICPGGFICSTLGLASPLTQCVAGHYCSPGTKMSSRTVNLTTTQWILDEETGVTTAATTNNSAWDYIPRESPATGGRRIFHPPSHTNVTAEQPFPCELGYYCRVGVSSGTEYRKDDFSTPQLCHNGHFCPRGSIYPEGAGPCPTGYYCPNQDNIAIPCDIGHYCPGTSNTFPLPCFPGSYNSLRGQNSCSLCEIGHQCPGWGRIAPEPCEAGFVCDQVGLSVPEKPCPSAYFCEAGTSTDDPQSSIGKPPLPCPPGQFCLYGVARRDLLGTVGLPSFDITLSQPCAEGYYCPGSSTTPLGNGPCFPGHYCPAASQYPVQVPPGTFADEGGSIVPKLCLPGTFSPRPGSISCRPCPSGFSCLSYGTFVPRICRPGTYRSKTDSIYCKLCPDRTYSLESGSTDISQCLPCLEGRVCGNQGLVDAQQSDVCPEGYVCGHATNRASRYDKECISGCICGNQTGTADQFSKYCEPGNVCVRGTSETLNAKDKCGKSHVCKLGTSSPEHFTTRCPRQTTSRPGSKEIESCIVSHVSICDKKSSSPTNPFDDNSYYQLLDQSGRADDAEELLVVKKVLPFNSESSNVLPWKNDTLEVFRLCPSYGTQSNDSSIEKITVFGRNFRNSTDLRCRFRVCLNFRLKYQGQTLIFPGICRDNSAESNFGNPLVFEGVFVDENRVLCPLPDFASFEDLQPVNTTRLPSSESKVCLRDDEGQLFLSQKCSDAEVALGTCSFEPSIPSYGLRKRIYSLFIPCVESDIAGGQCSNSLNPCHAQQISVDVSNNGKKFSGDSTIVPYTLSDRREDLFLVNSTFAVYDIIRDESIEIFHSEANEMTMANFNLSRSSDEFLCHRPLAHEVGRRLIEDGWFRSDYMTQFQLSFDWRHIPSHIVYNLHYKLAIYVVPSRCNESTCNGSGRKHNVHEKIPCQQPIDLPLWFVDDAVDKNQIMNISLLSLDDTMFRVEVQIVHGLALPMAEFFKKSMKVVMDYPRRAKTFGEIKTPRKLSPLVSWDEVPTFMSYIFGIRYDETNFNQVSPPMNLPPRWKDFERGRVLTSMNTTHENSSPTIKDVVEANTKRGNDFWSNPYPSALVAKEQTDLYFETFHGISPDDSLQGYMYEHDSLILPYLPYFSNCREFDSYIPFWAIVESSSDCKLPGVTADYPEDWWRRRIPPLPHQDDVRAIGPLNFMEFYPIADWCERKLHCHYEENLSGPDVIPRWFEADAGVTLFSIIRDPIDYFEYTGRDSVTIGRGDGGGQKFIQRTQQLQTYIPAKVDRSPAFNVEGGCTMACFPRKVSLDISYQQVDVHTKRIVQVKVLYDKFDKDASDDKYELQIKFHALNYQDLVIKFAFSRGLFLLLFSQIGIGTIIASFLYWIVTRLTTSLENPPSLRISKFLLLIFPSAFGGVILGLIPICLVTASVYYLSKGHLYFGHDSDSEGRQWLQLPTIPLNYSDVGIDPDHLRLTRQGRTGFAFLSMALASFYFTGSMFVPNRKLKANSSNIALHGKHSDRTVAWRRYNLIYSSVLMSLFLVVIVEWSFWGSFGAYIWEAIIFMKFLSMIVGSIVDAQLGEALLSVPVMTAMGMVQGIVTMAANDFVDFLVSYIVGFGFLIIERMYIGPLQSKFVTWVVETCSLAINRILKLIKRSQEANPPRTINDESVQEENSETLEPLLSSFTSYSCDILSLLYSPFIMVVIMIFQDETEITKMYGIKEADMEYYVLFALAIIPFQMIADVLLHNSLELLHGWKTLDYLEYCHARFFQREVFWKGLENNTMDECIEESLRGIDQLCFSSQYYMMNTIHVNAIVYFVMGVVMMVRANYNLFGDPAIIPIFAAVLVCSMTVKMLMIWFGRLARVWRVRLEKRNWHERMQIDGDTNSDKSVDIHNTSHDLYKMELRMTEDAFRYKFLRYNRSWIIQQLPDLLTPRIIQRSRPYMINQLARVLASINVDISSDSDGDDDLEFVIPTMHSSTRTILRKWLTKASRLLKLRQIVQPLIQQSRGNECEVCLSRNLLQVETYYTIEQIDEMFLNEFGASDDQLDQVLWKKFFKNMQRYQTICIPCMQGRKRKREEELLNDDKDEDMGPDVVGQPDSLNQRSTAIIAMWHAKARAALEYGQSINHE